MTNLLKIMQERPALISNLTDKDTNLSVSLGIASSQGKVKLDMYEVEIGDYFVTNSNRLSKVIAIGPVVRLEDDFDGEGNVYISEYTQILVFKDCLSGRIWSYSLAGDRQTYAAEGISSELSVREYQVVYEAICNGYEVDMPSSGSNPTYRYPIMCEGAFLAIHGLGRDKWIRSQYAVGWYGDREVDE